MCVSSCEWIVKGLIGEQFLHLDGLPLRHLSLKLVELR